MREAQAPAEAYFSVARSRGGNGGRGGFPGALIGASPHCLLKMAFPHPTAAGPGGSRCLPPSRRTDPPGEPTAKASASSLHGPTAAEPGGTPDFQLRGQGYPTRPLAPQVFCPERDRPLSSAALLVAAAAAPMRSYLPLLFPMVNTLSCLVDCACMMFPFPHYFRSPI